MIIARLTLGNRLTLAAAIRLKTPKEKPEGTIVLAQLGRSEFPSARLNKIPCARHESDKRLGSC